MSLLRLSLCAWLTAVAAAQGQVTPVALASTLDDAGLGAKLAAAFPEASCELEPIAVTSARGISLLANGDVQAAITHAPRHERQFIAAVPGRSRSEFASSDFVLAGPPSDPAAINGLGLQAALRQIARSGATFLSRDDGSGTHEMETLLWLDANGSVPTGANWYLRGGGNMGAALWVAAETGAYTLSESATLARLRRQGLPLVALARDEPPRANVYSILLPPQATSCAASLASWLNGKEARLVIDSHAIGKLRPFRALP